MISFSGTVIAEDAGIWYNFSSLLQLKTTARNAGMVSAWLKTSAQTQGEHRNG